MATPDLSKIIMSNEIKNGASILSVTKTGIETTFDNSRDTENGLDAFENLINDRFDETMYYLPWGTPS